MHDNSWQFMTVQEVVCYSGLLFLWQKNVFVSRNGEKVFFFGFSETT